MHFVFLKNPEITDGLFENIINSAKIEKKELSKIKSFQNSSDLFLLNCLLGFLIIYRSIE